MFPVIDAEAWDWQWELVGNESPDERLVLEKMLAEAKRFIADMASGAEPRWLVLVGTSGVGKSHLADRVRWWVKARGRAVYEQHYRRRLDPHGDSLKALWTYAQSGAMMCRWGRLISKMRAGEFGAMDEAAGDWFKVVDDFGVDSFDRDGNVTKFAVQKMTDLVERRLRKWTVITSNYTRSQFGEMFDPRIASRLMRHGSVIVDASAVRDFNIRREERIERAA
jgi:hypothetical protein